MDQTGGKTGLEEFVSLTWVEVVNSVKKAKKKLEPHCAVVVPARDPKFAKGQDGKRTTERAVVLVNCDVAVTATKSTTGSGKLSLELPGLGKAGDDGGRTWSSERASRIQFQVALGLPDDKVIEE